MNAINQHEIGLYNKFKVTRTDGKDAAGEKHEHDEYFVLSLSTDKNSIPAICAYIEACKSEYPALAADLHAKIAEINDKKNAFTLTPRITLPNGTVVEPFKIMTHLAGRGAGDLPVSNIDAAPWIEVSYFDHLDATAKAGYEPLTSLQSLAISWDIYNQPANWLSGQVGVGSLKQGLHKGTINCAQPGNYVSPYPEEDRWFVLSNGERIFDWSGNVFQWMFDNLHGDERGLTGKIPADSPLLITCPLPSKVQGSGWRPDGGADWSGTALVRGGCWCSGSSAGVFDLYGGSPGSRDDYVGFRCTKPISL